MTGLFPTVEKNQLSQMCGKDKGSINVIIPTMMKQDSNIDCCLLFAMAYITSYCVRKELSFDIIFDPTKLGYICKCFETRTISKVPTTCTYTTEAIEKC